MHHFVPSEDTPASGIDPAHTAAIRRWVTERLGLGEGDVVGVLESPCTDPGCPLVETVVAVFSEGETRRYTFTRPKAAVTKAMVWQCVPGAKP